VTPSLPQIGRSESMKPGLRVQIVLALAGLMLLANVPLFFALASVTRATLLGARTDAARALGRAVAAHVGDAMSSGDHAALGRTLESHVGESGALALAVYDRNGKLDASAGNAAELAVMHAPTHPYGESTTTVRGTTGRALEVTVPHDDAVVVARLRTDEDADRAAPLVRLVALYMTTFALALLVFAYFSLTRLIVRPVEALVRAADKVASGARVLEVPRGGARELTDLGVSVNAMTARLLADEAQLRAKVAELTQTTQRLTEARAHLARSERLASVGRLAAGIGHEIGNPIAAIMGMQELLLDGDLPKDTERDFLVRMKKETERIHSILRDLLDFARPEQASVSSAKPEPSDVRAVLDDVVALLRPQKSFRDVVVTVDADASLPKVALSASRLTQVLLNLALNAGDALVTSREGKGTLRLGANLDGTTLRIVVEDDGPGIADEVKDRLFEPFVTTKDVGAGTGLGLAVCRGIVEGAGGEIAVDGAFAAGARFVIRLPAVV
jgi:two-component system, NtrC family, sensor kinase